MAYVNAEQFGSSASSSNGTVAAASNQVNKPSDTGLGGNAFSSLMTAIGAINGLPSSQENTDELVTKVQNGDVSPEEAISMIVSDRDKYGIDGQTWEYLSNMLSNQRTKEAYDRDIQAILDKAKATQQAAIDTGLNPSAYMMSQGFGDGTSVGAAKVSNNNPASDMARSRFQAKTDMARTLLGLIGGMSSAGIYGGSMAAARHAVAGLTTAATRDAATIRAAGSVAAAKARNQDRRIHIDNNGLISQDLYYY